MSGARPKARLACMEQPVPALGPDYRVVTVVPWAVGHDLEVEGLVDCDPDRAMRAAHALLTYAIDNKPELLTDDGENFYAQLIACELAEVMQRAIEQRMRASPPTGVMMELETKARWEFDEKMFVSQAAARQRGLREVRDLVRALVEAASEPDATSRTLMLSGLVPEIGRVTRS
jgi:hypothetical protein